jgi:hypothetical protein
MNKNCNIGIFEKFVLWTFFIFLIAVSCNGVLMYPTEPKIKEPFASMGFTKVTPPPFVERFNHCEYIKPSRKSGYWECYSKKG